MPDILFYLGAAVMVILAVFAYRYWNSTAEFARRAREKQARLKHDALVAAAAAPPHSVPEAEAGAGQGETNDVEGGAIPEEASGDTGAVEAAPPNGADEVEEGESPETTGEMEEVAEDEAVDHAGVAVEVTSEGTGTTRESAEKTELSGPQANGEETDPDGPEPGPDEEFEPDVADAIAYRLIDELEPRSAGEPPADRKTVTAQLDSLEEQLADLPSGIELMELPTVERRRVADLRRALEKDRARLWDHRKKGAHRRKRRRNSG